MKMDLTNCGLVVLHCKLGTTEMAVYHHVVKYDAKYRILRVFRTYPDGSAILFTDEPYNAKFGPNSNTATNSIITGAGGTVPDIPGAWQQHYGQ
jgi:hypothetical protein